MKSSIRPRDHEICHVLDSLPYVDYMHEDYEAYALSLIEKEMKNIPQRSVPALEEPFFSTGDAKLVKARYEQLVANESLNFIDFTSSSTCEPKGVLKTDEHAWRESLRTAKSEFERQRIRQSILELQQAYDTGKWKMHNESLEAVSNGYKNMAELHRRSVDEVNANRTMMQEKVGPKLNELAHIYDDLLSKNKKLADATNILQKEVDTIKTDLGISSLDNEEL